MTGHQFHFSGDKHISTSRLPDADRSGTSAVLPASVLMLLTLLACLPGCASRPHDYTWQKHATPLTSCLGSLAVVDGRLYILGGIADSNVHRNNCTDAIWRYDPSADRWTQMTCRLPYPLLSAAGNPAVVGRRVILSPGFGPTVNGGWGQHNRIIEYDVDANRAEETAAFPGEGALWGCLILTTTLKAQPRVFSFGGWNGGPIGKVFEYDLQHRTLRPVETAGNQPNYLNCGAALGDGRVVVFRGKSDPWTAEVFDPVRGTTSTNSAKPSEPLNGWSLAWRDGRDNVLAAATRTGKVVSYEPTSGAFSDAGIALPKTSEGFEMGNGVADECGRWLFVTEQRWDGGRWRVNLWVGMAK